MEQVIPAPGMVLAQRYRLDAEIGHGGFSQVFRATELRIGREVAVKIMSQDSVDAAGEQRFAREAELARQLRHPNTVHLLDFDLGHRPSPFIVYELLSGETLEAVLKREGPVAEQRAARIAAQILKSLMEAHAMGVVHRDMKPGNVFLCTYAGETDFVKVLDFGIAKGAESTPLTAAGMVIGTPRYMPPDQILGKPPHPSMDLYAVGMMLAEMLCGHPIVRGTPMEAAQAQLAKELVPLPEVVERSVLGRLIRRATEKSPEARFANGQEMLAELERLSPRLSSEPLAPRGFGMPESALPSGQVPTQLLGPPSGAEPTRVQPIEILVAARRAPAPRRNPLLFVAVGVSALALLVLLVAIVLVWRWRSAERALPEPVVEPVPAGS
ncbi:MAG: serine/threonine protein kinase [Myxococcales bacterium]|nr:serine/threonine protein kinase [Myxococcales bacterium]